MKAITIASKHNGRVFGGFVRNVLVPQMHNMSIPGYKDVDIWFQTQLDADQFVTDMGDKFIKRAPLNKETEASNGLYPFGRIQYMLKGSFLAKGEENRFLSPKTNLDHGAMCFDVIVSPTLPVDVNQLAYNSYEGFRSLNDKCDSKTLIGSIVNKKAVMLPGYTYKSNKSDRDRIQKRRLGILINSGWTITKNNMC
jgi:hypothetical protein